MSSIAVIDYGMGNLHSVAKALEHVGEKGLDVRVTADEDAIMTADRVLFPGVGAIRDCMAEIRRLRVDHMVREVVKNRPVLAICVGLQALMESSDENGGVACIGMFEGDVRRFADGQVDEQGQHLKVPHMGWNTVSQTGSHPLWQGIPDHSRFYFVHSYYVVPKNGEVIMGESAYPQTFTAAIGEGNLFATQFHPEKSQTCGLQLLKNFLYWKGDGNGEES